MTLPKQEAQKIITDHSEIRILERRLHVEICQKCWEYSHTTKKCTGPDRCRLCFKCGEEGHSARDCKNSESCPVCHKADHRAGKMREVQRVPRQKITELTITKFLQVNLNRCYEAHDLLIVTANQLDIDVLAVSGFV
ncbi:unnamed protein product [Ceutorhynchus assimilis]|uniref:CCHC-type domain-containing protein n=1 Tax=Ceutorhynchus assimilis TaxID=467358 RepID=A0A9N9QIK5_9CUCU|nr:unnamed protein product [Ceutorhynchus assimilis]